GQSNGSSASARDWYDVGRSASVGLTHAPDASGQRAGGAAGLLGGDARTRRRGSVREDAKMSFSPVCELPPVVAFKLGEVRRRARRLEAAEGAVSAMSVLVLAMMAAMLIDDIVAPVDVRWRIALTGSALGLAALHLVRGLLRPLLLRRPLAAIAHRVEAAVPVLQERWSTLSEL